MIFFMIWCFFSQGIFHHDSVFGWPLIERTSVAVCGCYYRCVKHLMFAYGSNMDLDDLARWAQSKGLPTPRVFDHYVACLRGFERVWNYHSRARAGGAANVQPAEGCCVWGLVLEVDLETRHLIDRKEGHPDRYSRGEAPLVVELPQDGRTVRAWVYQVTPPHIRDELIPPTQAYLDLIIQSAIRHNFPPGAVEALQATPIRG